MRWQGIVRKFGTASELTTGFAKAHYLSESPAQRRLEKEITEWTGAQASAVTNCGMAAIGAVLEYLLQSGGEALFSKDLYPGTTALAKAIQSRNERGVLFVNPLNLRKAERLVLTYWPKFYFFEIIGNSPRMPVIDWAETMKALKGTGAIAVVDTTFAPTFHAFEQEHDGVELIEVASMSKWEGELNGVAGGRISGSSKVIAEIKKSPLYRQVCLQPAIAEKISLRGLREKFSQFSFQAREAAEMLAGATEVVAKVHYPGLANHPQRHLVLKQFRGQAGGVLYAVMKGGVKAAARFTDLLSGQKWWSVAASFGGTDWRILPFIGELEKHSPEKGLVRIAAGSSREGLGGLMRALIQLGAQSKLKKIRR